MKHNPHQKKLPLRQAKYWHRTRHLTLTLLLIWFLTTFVIVFFARQLSSFTFFGWPFSFYMAAQGTTLIYVAIVGFYAWRMQGLDQTCIDKTVRHGGADGQ